jgi:hypothetical protein
VIRPSRRLPVRRGLLSVALTALLIDGAGAQAAERARRAAPAAVRQQETPFFGEPRLRPDRAGLPPSFVKTRGRPYAVIRTALNPLVSAEYPGTPEYEYLYTPASALRAPPPVGRYAYARDFGYLLRPYLAISAPAAAYAWRDTPLQLLRSSVGATAKALRPDAGITRNPGQKIDNALRPYSVLPGDQRGIVDASPGRSDAFAPVGRPGSLR